ncbi:MAG: SPOR domain-containing protein [Pseudomonadota bacterium]
MTFRFSPPPRRLPVQRQRGNTLLGIIIGLVIGLVIAVIVALVISKGSMPFTDKSGKAKSSEPTAGQITDPNKPMYGNKEAAREAARDFSRDQPKVTATPAPAAAPATPASPPARTTPAAPAADPLQQVVDKIEAASKSKPAAPASTAATPASTAAATAAQGAAGEDKFVYYLQAGAFREVPDAENTRAKLALLGFEAAVSDRSTDTGVLHRVRIGPFTQVEAMNKVRSKLSENGIDVAVVRNQK